MRVDRKLLVLMLVQVFTVLLLLFYVYGFHFDTTASRGLKLNHRLQSYSNHSVGVISGVDTRHAVATKWDARSVWMERHPPTTPSPRTALAEHVERACRRRPDRRDSLLHPRLFHHILVDDRYKMLYCYVPKVACTNWQRVLLVLSGKVKVNNVLDISSNDVHNRYKNALPTLSSFRRDGVRYRLNNYYKFMFVREPFERLVSAYRNKFQLSRNASSYFRRKVAPRIDKYPGLGHSGTQSGETAAKGSDAGRVSFVKFLQFVTDPEQADNLNEHWEKVHELCRPCAVHYDLVGKYETLNDDADHVLKAVHVDHLVDFPKRYESSYRHGRTSTLLKDYYQDVPPSLLTGVYRTFARDFDMFNYSVPDDVAGLFQP